MPILRDCTDALKLALAGLREQIEAGKQAPGGIHLAARGLSGCGLLTL